MVLSHYVSASFSLKSLIKKVINNLGIGSEKLKFVSISTFYEDNNGSIGMATITSMTPTPKNISAKYLWFRKHIRRLLVIRKIESENQKVDIFTKGLKSGFLSSLGSIYAVGKHSDERG